MQPGFAAADEVDVVGVAEEDVAVDVDRVGDVVGRRRVRVDRDRVDPAQRDAGRRAVRDVAVVGRVEAGHGVLVAEHPRRDDGRGDGIDKR